MLNAKEFIFTPGIWKGHGKIAITSSSESLSFYTKWSIEEEKNNLIRAVQVVEIEGMPEKTINNLSFTTDGKDAFSVILQNQFMEKYAGVGIREKQMIQWSFSHPMVFEGNETYQFQKNGDYIFCAVYGNSQDFQTIVKGVIWTSDS
jgi:hypothetical protein